MACPLCGFNVLNSPFLPVQMRQNQLDHEDEVMRIKEQLSDAQRCDVILTNLFVSSFPVSWNASFQNHGNLDLCLDPTFRKMST